MAIRLNNLCRESLTASVTVDISASRISKRLVLYVEEHVCYIRYKPSFVEDTVHGSHYYVPSSIIVRLNHMSTLNHPLRKVLCTCQQNNSLYSYDLVHTLAAI